MHISRRQFAGGIAGFAALGSAVARRPVVNGCIIEQRIYAFGSVLPPSEVLHRHGIETASVKQQCNGIAYSILFASLEARVKAWDRFNADDDWCAIRDAGKVALQETRIYVAGHTRG